MNDTPTIPTPLPVPRIHPAYPSGRHEYDGLHVLGKNTTVADLKDAIWWLFYGKTWLGGHAEGPGGHGMWLKTIVEALGQGTSTADMRSPESLVRCVRNVQADIDLQRDERAKREAKERAEYEKLHAKYGGANGSHDG